MGIEPISPRRYAARYHSRSRPRKQGALAIELHRDGLKINNKPLLPCVVSSGRNRLLPLTRVWQVPRNGSGYSRCPAAAPLNPRDQGRVAEGQRRFRSELAAASLKPALCRFFRKALGKFSGAALVAPASPLGAAQSADLAISSLIGR